MKDYLTGHHTNNLLKSVLHDLEIQQFVAGAKALGLASRILTEPLWCLIEDQSIHILKMNIIYSKIVDFQDKASLKIDDFMTGKLLPFGDFTELKRDAIYEVLITKWEHDDIVQVFLESILLSVAKLAKRIFKNHLPGGCWNDVTTEMKERCTGTHKHNKFAESVFGYLDNLLRKSPNISVLASEAFIMFTANKTDQWLQSKSKEEKCSLIASAKNTASVKLQFQQRKTWQSELQVDEKLAEISTITEKKKALKAQLNFRQFVLKQKPDESNVFAFSQTVNGQSEQLTVQELTTNLKKKKKKKKNICCQFKNRIMRILDQF